MAGLTKTTSSIKEADIKRNWHLIDMNGKVLGRSITEISQLLIGKHKSTFSPHMDSGDHVVVINARNVKVTGRKEDQKVYTRYSGYPGGLKEVSYKHQMEKDPRKIIQNAVSGMLPKNKHRSRRMARLHVFADAQHSFEDKFTK